MYLRGLFDDEALHEYYYDTAIRLLIDELPKEQHSCTVDVLGSTTAILRMREQFSEVEHDGEFHLHGMALMCWNSGNPADFCRFECQALAPSTLSRV